jgi:hypothetical protein
MLPMLVLMALLAAPALSQAPAPAQKPAAAADATLPSARSIIDRYVAAVGGRDAIMAHTSSHAVGTISVPSSGLNGTVETYGAANPNRTIQKVFIPGIGSIDSGFDGIHGWTVSAMTGAQLMTGKELAQTRQDADFYSELRDAKIYTTVTTVDKETFEGKPCYKVSLKRVDGTEDFDLYDVETGLRDGSINTRESPMGTVTATSVESGYTKFGNILVATRLSQKIMGTEQIITITSMDFDKVDASVFTPPAAIQALIK